MTDNQRIRKCKADIIAAINKSAIPYSITELILENILFAVRENMADEEAKEDTKVIDAGKTDKAKRS